MTFILLLLLQFNTFAQKDIYSLTDQKTKGTPTIRLRPTRFLVYQALASSSKATAQKEFSEAISRTRNQVTQANIIPIGILNADIETPDEKEKKKDFVLMASPIQKDIFQANVQFQISPKLLQTNLDNQIESIEISFDNGDNWKTYKYEEQLISYQFKSTGEQEIGFRINSKKGTYVSFATVDVKQLVRQAFVEPKRVSAPATKVGEAAATVNGAEYRIVMGCDGIFDKPIIIAEGFDAGQNVNLDDLQARYFEPLELYRNNGYDLVLVNYDNGRTWINDNAQVLKAVINQVNATKVGNNKLVVIGESMSGLVARWALREMENAGQDPNVSHFVAFDTPMRGANVPAGFIGLRRWAPSAFGVSIVLLASFLNDVFDAYPVVNAIDEPAAKQMLLTQQGTGPAPEFTQFQTAINNLGYPSRYGIKNIALINGALNGAAQRRYTAQDIGNGRYTESDQGPLDQGNKIFDYSIWAIFDAEVWTHTINVNSRVGRGNVPFRIFTPASNFDLNSPINYDRHPGGRQVSRTGSVYTSFGFVPTFSSIDYRGTLNNDNDYYFNIRNFINGGNNQVTNAALTPFAAIYGDDRNDIHARPTPEQDAFDQFGIIELGMTTNGGCVGCGGGTGLAGTYFNNNNLVNDANNRTSNTNEGINFASGERRYTPFWGSVIIPPYGTFTRTDISARWEGTFQAPIAATYNFNVRTDDGTRVWFDGVQKVIDWGNYPPKDHPFYEYLKAGDRRNITIEWFQGGGQYEAKLLWGFNGIETFIPACHLFPVTTDCNFTVSATASPATVSCGGTSTLTATCTGSGCSGVSYNWRESGSFFDTVSGSPVSINLRNQNGTYNYNLTASKIGCGDKTPASNPAIRVILCSGQRDMNISNSVGLTNVSNSTNQGSFKVNSTNVNWVISGVPTWASINTSTGGNGTTDINVSFQANNGAYRDATLVVNDVTDFIPDQTITISQQGTGGGLPACNCGFTLLSANQNAGQYAGTYTFNSCNASSHKWKLLDGATEITNSGSNAYTVTSSTVNFNVPSSVNTGNYQLRVDADNCTGSGTLPFNYTKPGGGGCNSPTPSLSANPSTVPSTLTASGCSGTVSWSTGATGNSIFVSTAGTYTATCTNSGCSTSGNGSVTVSGGGGNPDRTENGIASDDNANNPGNEGEAQAFDNQNGTKWLVFNSTGNIAYDFANEDAYAINSYTVTSANDEPARDPKNWNFQGSNDGSNWTTVDSQNNQFYGNRFETKTFNINNTTAYKQYRLNVTGNNGSNLLQIGEIQMFGPLGTGGGTGGGTGVCSNINSVNAGNASEGYTHTINITTADTYKFKITYATGESNATGNITVDSDPAIQFSVGPSTGSWTPSVEVLVGNVQKTLSVGNHTVRISGVNNVSGSNFAHNKLCAVPASSNRNVSRMAVFEEEEKPISIYPNPTTGKIKIVFALQKAENVWLNLYDVQGKSLDLRDFEGKLGRNEMEYDLQNYSSGAYFVNFQSSEKREVLKVMKVN